MAVDDRAGDHGLPGAGRRDQHGQVVAGQLVSGFLLSGVERCGECELLDGALGAIVRDIQAATRLLCQGSHRIAQATRQNQPTVEGLIEAAHVQRRVQADVHPPGQVRRQHLDGRTGMHRTRRRIKQSRLRRAGWRRLGAGQLQQAQQACVFGPQLRQFPRHTSGTAWLAQCGPLITQTRVRLIRPRIPSATAARVYGPGDHHSEGPGLPSSPLLLTAAR
jgi:hypothetical protein